VSWPPPPPKQDRVSPRPWDPRHPEHPRLVEEYERLFYVVVDELVDDWAGLSVSAWPDADTQGRLRFTRSPGAMEVGVSLKALSRFLAGPDSEPAGEEADPRVGTTFAALSRRGVAAQVLHELGEDARQGKVRIDRLEDLFERPVDLTPQARLVAELAHYGAVLSTMPPELEDRWRLSDEIEE
jgi:hypothetical protein